MIELKLAEASDFAFYYALKCEESNIFWTGHAAPPDYSSLQKYYSNIIENQRLAERRKIYMIIADGETVGCLYFVPDEQNFGEFDIPVSISEKFWGKGYAKAAVAQGLELGKQMGFKRHVGKIREDNRASLKVYLACGDILKSEYELVYIPKLRKEVKMYRVEKELESSPQGGGVRLSETDKKRRSIEHNLLTLSFGCAPSGIAAFDMVA